MRTADPCTLLRDLPFDMVSAVDMAFWRVFTISTAEAISTAKPRAQAASGLGCLRDPRNQGATPHRGRLRLFGHEQLVLGELTIERGRLDEFRVCALADHAAVFEHDDLV